ncbi:hypothetical protein GC093_11125 [Paenibacillus sp. LMG 31456]|uniref:Uncharacterized protein n=1 Tax=Paenibacillus foliorum TaxID=2654974 RepID=A0A972GPI0_9BACL|nr:hypothetical protein [Paenibacillus foliorum]NOU93770.1 hypothetical protein [Paenibacillus foliorum]
MKKIFTFALVTPMGIYINELFYTCPKAIEGQWFYRAALYGTWLLPVIYSKEAEESIKVIYDGEIFVANVVPDTSKISIFIIRSIEKGISLIGK